MSAAKKDERVEMVSPVTGDTLDVRAEEVEALEAAGYTRQADKPAARTARK